MKIPVIGIYANEFKSAYIVNNKDRRKRVILVGNNGERKGMLLARYIWEDANGKIPDGLQIDHINNDPTDDRLCNLQLLTQFENTQKYHQMNKPKVVILTCPVCNKRFEFPKRNLSSHREPCCSRHCGGIKGARSKKLEM